MTDQNPPEQQPSEEELRAAYEQQLAQLRVQDVVLQTVVSLINLGGRKAGLAQGTENERDPEQVKLAVDAARALLPLVEPELGQDASALRDALSQLQMAYVRLSGQEPGGSEPGGGAPKEPEPPAGGSGPAQSSGRLWVPGQ